MKLDYATGAGANRYVGWDRFGRIVDLLWQSYAPESSSSSSDEPPGLVHLQYGYDRAGNRTHRRDLVARFYDKIFDERYEYDGLHRLKKFHRGRLVEGDRVIESPTLQQGWRLDATGNWQNFTQHDSSDPAQTLDQQRVANQVNEITQIARTVGPAWATPQYDRNGNMTVIPQPKQMTESYRAAWDAWNRLVKLEEPTPSGGWRPLAEYQYDGQTWRTLAKNYTAGALDETRHTYFSSHWQALEDRLGATPATAPPERQFVWGLRYIDDLVLRDRDTEESGALDERLYGLQDANWNVVAVSDVAAEVQFRFAYSAYGTSIGLTDSFTRSNAQVFHPSYAGYNDTPFAIWLARHRYFSPANGAWLSPDPLYRPQMRGPGEKKRAQYAAHRNWFSYSARPLQTTDPFGLFPLNPYAPPAYVPVPGGPSLLYKLFVECMFGALSLGAFEAGIAFWEYQSTGQWPKTLTRDSIRAFCAAATGCAESILIANAAPLVLRACHWKVILAELKRAATVPGAKPVITLCGVACTLTVGAALAIYYGACNLCAMVDAKPRICTFVPTAPPVIRLSELEDQNGGRIVVW